MVVSRKNKQKEGEMNVITSLISIELTQEEASDLVDLCGAIGQRDLDNLEDLEHSADKVYKTVEGLYNALRVAGIAC